jgi:hypothetical protein
MPNQPLVGERSSLKWAAHLCIFGVILCVSMVSVPQIKIIARKVCAGFMALWLSGVVFILCCHLQNGYVAGRDSCPLVKLGAHCDKAEKAKQSEIITSPGSDQGMDCCSFIPAFFDKTRTNDSSQQVAVAAPIAIPAPSVTVITRYNYAFPHAYQSPPIPKNDTFLKNHSFRI